VEEKKKTEVKYMKTIEKLFKLNELNTNVRTEVLAGITTFMTMAYIIFVNPLILSNAGLSIPAVASATCLISALTCILMGICTNYPFALAPGMGLNAFIAFSICKSMNLPWQVGMAIIFIEGSIITILVLTKFRAAVMNAIPLSLKKAISIGIGLFIAFIGLQNAGIVVDNPATLISMGNFNNGQVLLALIGFVVTILFISLRMRGAILLGIVVTAIIGIPMGLTKIPQSIVALPDFSSFGGFAIGLKDMITLPLWLAVFACLVSDFFDTMGTVIGVGEEGGFLKEGKLARLNRVLFVDSLGAMFGGIFGSSSATTYIESATGVASGGRSGLTSITVGLLFLLALFFSPLVSVLPACATAPALILVGYHMMSIAKDIPWNEFDEALPSFMVMLVMPLTFSISHGIGCGFISYVLIKIFKGKFNEIHPLLLIVAILFAISFSPLVPK